MIPKPIQKFIDVFSKLPALGPRLVTRLAFHLVSLSKPTFKEFEEAFAGLKELDRCERCFFLKEAAEKVCEICRDERRDKAVVAIVEKETDVLALEKSGKFNGQYLVLGELPERGMLEPNHKLRLQSLKSRIARELGGKAEEIIIALNLNTFGDFVGGIIKQEFKDLAKKITRLGRGIPTGGEIEFADEETLISALERRN
jgi:recombination protein RecR